MAPMSKEQLRKARAKARDSLLRLAHWKLREMRDKYIGGSRTRRPGKQQRAKVAAGGRKRGPSCRQTKTPAG